MSAAGLRQVPFNALAPGVRVLRADLDAAIGRVLDRGYFLLGPENEAFEQAFGAYHGADYQAVGVGSGTDALRIGLQALGVAPGDEVLVVANAGVPPVAAVVAAGARPVFCDVDPRTHTLNPAEIDRRATPRTRAVLVVHLYGRVAEMDAVVASAHARGLRVLEDCAQAHGARYRARLAGTLGDAAAFSFYPTKNLGALGDGGAVLSADPRVVDRGRLLRNYGWRQKYYSEIHSTNTRLDELQAAVLLAKLPHLETGNERRRRLAAIYGAALAPVAGELLSLPEDPSAPPALPTFPEGPGVETPAGVPRIEAPAQGLVVAPGATTTRDVVPPEHASAHTAADTPGSGDTPRGANAAGNLHVYHLYVTRVAADRRAALRAYLAERGVGTDVHYPLPAHLQPPYLDYGQGPGSLPHTEALAEEVLSLPLYPELAEDDVRYVAEQIRAFARASGR